MPTLVHFDISADNLERAKKFYKELFGWSIHSMPGFSDYFEIETTDLNGKNGVGGGLTKRDQKQQKGITNFIGVNSIDETIEKVVLFGGTVIQPKQIIPGYGCLAVCSDTEDNIIGLFEENKKVSYLQT